jgi:dTDP-4-amino-4,6-dideoxygalactose transaminase
MVGHLGDIACFSFNGNKVITTGGGGMIATDHEGWARRARYLTTQANDDPVEYISHEIGYNYRLTNIQAAMGCAQLEQISEFLAAKRRSAAGYRAALEDIPGLTPMQEAPWACSSFWLFTALVDEVRYGMDSRTLLRHLWQRGIQARPLWQPVHRSPAHRGAQAYRVEVADRLHRSALSLPSSVGLSQTELSAVVDTMRIGRT